MPLEELVSRIAASAGISAETAESALRIILNFLHTDGPSETVERLAAEMGASELLGAKPAGGGLLGAIGGLFGGGGAMAAFSALTGAGLDMDQIQKVVGTFVDFARERVGPEMVDEITGSIPGLKQLL